MNKLEELRTYEQKKEEEYQKLLEESDKAVEKAQADIPNVIEKEKDALLKEKKTKIEKAEAEAKQESKKIHEQYEKKIESLVTKATNNTEKAVTSIFKELLK